MTLIALLKTANGTCKMELQFFSSDLGSASSGIQAMPGACALK